MQQDRCGQNWLAKPAKTRSTAAPTLPVVHGIRQKQHVAYVSTQEAPSAPGNGHKPLSGGERVSLHHAKWRHVQEVAAVGDSYQVPAIKPRCARDRASLLDG